MLKKKWKQKILDFYVNFFLKKCKINNNILITSTDGIGDNIIRLNLLEEIFKHYNKSKCYIVCDNKTAFLIKKIGFENIIVFTKNMRNGLFGKIKLLTFLFKIGFCKIISLEYDQHDFDIQYFDNIVSYSYDNKFHSEMNKYYKILIPSYFNTTEESVINYFKVLFKKNISETEVIPNLLKYYTYDFNKQEHNSLAIGIGAGARFKMLKPILFSKILKIIVEKKEINKVYFLGAGKRDKKYLNEFKKYMDDNYL